MHYFYIISEKPRGFAFVEFFEDFDADQAIDNLDDAEYLGFCLIFSCLILFFIGFFNRKNHQSQEIETAKKSASKQ